MSDSSDNEFIIRKQKGVSGSRVKNLTELFDEKEEIIADYSDYESEEAEEYIPRISNSTLRAVFGTGKEYAYLLEKTEIINSEQALSESVEIENLPKTSPHYDKNEIFDYLRNNIYFDIGDGRLKEFIELVETGVCVQFIVLHTFEADIPIHQAYRLLDLIDKLKSQAQEIEDVYGDFEKQSVILSFSEFSENLIANEMVHVPLENENGLFLFCESRNFDKETVSQRIATILCSSTIFKRAVFNYFKEEGSIIYDSESFKFKDFLDLNQNSGYQINLDYKNLTYKFLKAYTGDSGSEWDLLEPVLSLKHVQILKPW